jgi:hypothetical protein
MHNLNLKKGRPKMGGSSAIFRKLPKVNNHPLGEKIARSGHPGQIRQNVK